MRELVLEELGEALQYGPLITGPDGELTVDSVEDLQLLSDQELLTILITMLTDV